MAYLLMSILHHRQMSDCSDSSSGVANISSQADIDNGTLAGQPCFEQINIHGATGSLNFTNVQGSFSISVSDSPNLYALNFPKLSYLVNLNVSQAQSLSRISMPLLHTDNSPSLGIRITEALQLWDLDLGNDTQINSLSVLDSYGSLVFHNPTIYNLDFTFADIVFPQLTSVWNLTVTGGESEGLVAELDKLKTIYGSLVTQFLRVRFPELSHVATIGQAVSFISNAKVAMDFDDLISIGGDISVVNNANCSLNMNQLSSHWGDFSVVNNTNFSLNMNQLSSVGSFSMTGNVETTLPFLSSLERAENIHLQGYIDPAPGPNIFPLLKYVSGSVTIEAWNSDFNCSKLVSQWYDGIIHNLYCNGTNNATTVRSNASHGLSDNAWAGIGVSIGVIATGAIIAVVWLFLHYRRRRNRGNKTTSEPEKQVEVQSPDLSGLHEAEPVGVVREAPDGALYELAVLPAEKPDDHLKEMPSPEICQLAR